VGDGGLRKWWIGGCLGLLLLAVLVVVILAGLTWHSVGDADPQESVRVQDPVTVVPGAPFKVTLELDTCELYLEPAAPGEPLSIEARYDANDYRIEEIVENGIPGSYRLRFLVTSSRLITAIKQGIHGGQPQLRIRIPVDTPLELSLLQRNGGAVVDLSRLHLLAADFDIEGAYLKLDANTPLEGRLERLTIRGGTGAILIDNLNRMNPSIIDAEFRMGEVHLDFRGEWESDSKIDLSLSLVDGVLRLPRDASIEGLDTFVGTREGISEIPQPTLSFSVKTGRRTDLKVFE